MNAIFLRTLAATTLLCCANAATAAATTAADPARLVMDCAHPVMPSLARVAAWSGTNNSTRVYEQWTKARSQLGRACRRAPGAQVELVLERPSVRRESEALANASR